MDLQLAANIFSLCAYVICVFHFLLIVGAPLGHLTMAGKYQGALPKKVRGVPVFGIAMLLSFSWIVQAKATGETLFYDNFASQAIWFVVGYNVLGVILHIITPSKWERRLWLPLISIMLYISYKLAII